MYGLYRLWTQHKLRVPNFRTSGWSGEAERRAQSVEFFSDERPSQSGRKMGLGEGHGLEFWSQIPCPKWARIPCPKWARISCPIHFPYCKLPWRAHFGHGMRAHFGHGKLHQNPSPLPSLKPIFPTTLRGPLVSKNTADWARRFASPIHPCARAKVGHAW